MGANKFLLLIVIVISPPQAPTQNYELKTHPVTHVMLRLCRGFVTG